MAEVPDVAEPLVVSAVRTRDFLTTTRAAIAALHLDDAVLEGIGDPFVFLADPEGIWLCPEDPSAPAHIRIGWSMIGKLSDSWDSWTGLGAVAADFVFGLVTGLGGGLGGPSGPTLRVPVLAKAGTIEMKIALLSQEGLAVEVEKRRPRLRYGPMLDWISPEGL